jgi:hypothetical protein
MQDLHTPTDPAPRLVELSAETWILLQEAIASSEADNPDVVLRAALRIWLEENKRQ